MRFFQAGEASGGGGCSELSRFRKMNKGPGQAGSEVLGVPCLHMADVPGIEWGRACREIASTLGRTHFPVIRTD